MAGRLRCRRRGADYWLRNEKSEQAPEYKRKKSTLITGLVLAVLPEENVKSRFAFLSGLGAFDSRQVFCASEKELKLFVNASEGTSLGPAKDKNKLCAISRSN